MKSRRLSIQIAALCIAALPIAALSQTGSPTLQVTSDWLTNTLKSYHAEFSVDPTSPYFAEFAGMPVIDTPYIDDSCTFQFSASFVGYSYRYLVPLGAVSSVSASPAMQQGDPGWQPDAGYVPTLKFTTGNAAIQAIKTLQVTPGKKKSRMPSRLQPTQSPILTASI
jgi:hypothetical protein